LTEVSDYDLIQCMKVIRQTTEVVSLSLPGATFKKLEQTRKQEGETRSNFIRRLIESYVEDNRWGEIYKRGEEAARKFNIKSEEDVDKILHA